LGQLPSFTLPTGAGPVRTSDYRSRRHLVIWLAGADPSPDALKEAASHEPAFRFEGAELLVVLHGPVERAEALGAQTGLRGRMLADADGQVHALLGAPEPVLLVANRNATIYWREDVEAGRPDFAEALSWLGYLNILEPECGTCVPAWPVDMLDTDRDP
jgi:hypothetical protein